MKQRHGFVSNSSSSSFMCNVCGNTESGMDLCLSEANMFDCVNGHTVCNEHKLKENEELARERHGDDFDVDNYEVPAELCPICQFKHFMDEDMLAYAIKLKLIDVNKLQESIKEGYTTYREFAQFMEEK